MFGFIILGFYPIFAWTLFKIYSGPLALLATVIVGYLLLPDQLAFDLPGMPSLDKHNIPVLAAALAVLIVQPRPNDIVMKGWIPRSFFSAGFLVLLFVALLFTSLANGDALVYGPTVLTGLGMKDAYTGLLGMGMTLLPLLLGRKLLAGQKTHRLFLIGLTIAGGVYSFLALYEVRMSPQLSNMVYGFFPHSFAQHVRGNGFRPIVFLSHGLWLSIFFALAVIASFSLFWSSDKSQRGLYLITGVWLFITLVLSKSLGAILITIVALFLLFFTGTRLRLLLVALIAGSVLIYPALRGGNLIPLDGIVKFAEGISSERGASLSFRIENENLFLEKTAERPLFGWGGYGRNFVFDTDGKPLTVPDGYWIITIGLGGWIRYIGEFGLLCFPIIIAAVRWRKFGLGPETIAIVIILTANVVDLIPNATITPITWMLAGALWGRIELGRGAETIDGEVGTDDIRPDKREVTRSRYTRYDPSIQRRKTNPHETNS